jgi:sugar lactone lactonase YvrE
MSVRIQQLEVPVSILGEGPIWSERDQCLYFVDIASYRVQAYWPETRAHKHWQFDTFTGSLAECRSGGLLLALGDRVGWFDPSKGSGSFETLTRLEDRPLNRLNDGKADPWGRFWVGSMQTDENAATGRLWCVTPSGVATEHAERVGVSNSLAFDKARHLIYFADSCSGEIRRAQLDSSHMPLEWERFARLDRGSPDGSTIDSEGCLWNAQWGASRVTRYTPEGKVDRVVETPVTRPSSCTFGGKDYKTLFITSAHYKMTDDERRTDSIAGSLLCVELDDVRGLAADLFDR